MVGTALESGHAGRTQTIGFSSGRVIPPAAIIAVAVAIPAGIVGALAVADKRRREALQQYSEQRGYQFERKRRGAEQALAEEFPISGAATAAAGAARSPGRLVASRSPRSSTPT